MSAAAKLRIELDRLIEVGDRPFHVALSLVERPAAVEGTRVVRVELDGLLEVLQGAVDPAAGGVGVAAVGEGGGVFRIELDRLVEVLDRAVVVALLADRRCRGRR